MRHLWLKCLIASCRIHGYRERHRLNSVSKHEVSRFLAKSGTSRTGRPYSVRVTSRQTIDEPHTDHNIRNTGSCALVALGSLAIVTFAALAIRAGCDGPGMFGNQQRYAPSDDDGDDDEEEHEHHDDDDDVEENGSPVRGTDDRDQEASEPSSDHGSISIELEELGSPDAAPDHRPLLQPHSDDDDDM